MRNTKGQFLKGQSYSTNTQFKKGEHWREHKPHWDKTWLEQKYLNENLSTTEIALLAGCTHKNISFWMKKHGIKGRSVSDARKIKYWGSKGEANGMYNVRGKNNPNWKGGISTERQDFYNSLEWKESVKFVFRRDNFVCQNCGQTHMDKKHPLHIHHIVSFKIKSLRADTNNLILLCKTCHDFVHSKKNINNKYIRTYEQYKNIEE